MPLQGPSGNYGAVTRDRYQRVLDMAQDDEDGFYTGRPRRTQGVLRVDTSLLDREADREGERARLAMTPGVTRGGSTRMRSSPDSLLAAPTAQRFERFGDTYSYDSNLAAEERGRDQATGEISGDKLRYDNLTRMPGITPRQAARIVYGRGDAFDPDAANAALAQYVRQPSRETAATAIERGASPYATPFTGGFDPEAQRARPGTQQYVDMQLEKFREEQRIRAEQDERMAKLRAELRPEPRDRLSLRQDKDGRYQIINMDDETAAPRASGVTGARPGARAAGAGAAFMTGTPAAPAAPARPEDKAAGFMRGLPIGHTTPPTGPHFDGDEYVTPPPGFRRAPSEIESRAADRVARSVPGASLDDVREAAADALEREGVDDPSPAQLQEAMNRITLARQMFRAGRAPTAAMERETAVSEMKRSRVRP